MIFSPPGKLSYPERRLGMEKIAAFVLAALMVLGLAGGQ